MGSSGSAVLGVLAWSVSPLGLVCLLPEGAPVLLLALPLRLRVQNVISHPAVYFSVTVHLVFPFASSHLAPFPARTGQPATVTCQAVVRPAHQLPGA